MSVELGPDDGEIQFILDWHYDLDVMDSGYIRDINTGKIYFAVLESKVGILYSLHPLTHREASELKRVLILNDMRGGFTADRSVLDFPTFMPKDIRLMNRVVDVAISKEWSKLVTNRPKVGTWARG